MQPYSVEWADSLNLEWVEANVDLQAALDRDSERQWNPAPRRANEPAEWSGTLGMWRMDRTGQCGVLIDVPLLAAEPCEHDWEIASQYRETQQYAEWMREGHMPPPVGMLRQTGGHLGLLNRRRWLAARMAGVENWWVWYWGPPHDPHWTCSRWWLPEAAPFYVNQFHTIIECGGDPARSLDPYVMGRLRAAGIVA